MKKEYIWAIIIVAVLIGGIVFAQSRQLSNQTAPSPAVEVEDHDEVEDADDIDEVDDDIDEDADESAPITNTKTGATSASAENVKRFEVEGQNFSFSLKEIRVKKGDTVEIVFINKNGIHDWVIDEFNAKTKQINTGESETIRFVANKVGSFEYYCSVGTHRQQGMVGTLIVE